MQRLFTLILLLLLVQNIQSQDRIRTEGSAQVEWFNYESRQDVEKRVKELAIVDALERAFGRVVVQGNATYIKNMQSGTNIETNSVFNMIANTSVKGEVLKEIRCSFKELKGSRVIDGNKEEITDVRCDVIVQAREISSPPISFNAYTLNCLNDGCRTDFFRSEEKFYLKFNTPVSGYLSIFLDDGTATSRLLPYRNMPVEFESSVPVKSDKEYVLFSIERNELSVEDNIVDEYELYTEDPQELNRLFIVFCTEPVNKPSLTKTANEVLLPDNLGSEDFQRWLHRSRAFFKDKMQVGILDIQISR